MARVPEEWNVLSMLEWGTEYFKEKGISNPRLSIEWLLADVLKVKRLDLYLQFDRPLSSDELQAVKKGILRRARYEPLQYIVGHTDFMNARILVSPEVLIPRPETEQLVEIILEQHSAQHKKRVLDIGTGSGCISIALKMERPSWSIFGIDISPKALEIARQNAAINQVDLQLIAGDIHKPKSIALQKEPPFDIIVSNPPYITPIEKKSLDREVREYEPEQALFHENILALYKDIQNYASTHLKPSGYLYLEINENFGQEIKEVLSIKNWHTYLKQDYSGKDRFIIAIKHS